MSNPTHTLKVRKPQPHVCMRCGKTEVSIEHESRVVDFKGLTLEVDGMAETVCRSCGYRWATDGQQHDNLAVLRAAYSQRRDSIRAEEGLLTGEQISRILADLNLTKSDAALLFGGGPNAFGKYMSGDVLQSVSMDRLIRLTYAFGHFAVNYLRDFRNLPHAPYVGALQLVAFESQTVSAPINAIARPDNNPHSKVSYFVPVSSSVGIPTVPVE